MWGEIIFSGVPMMCWFDYNHFLVDCELLWTIVNMTFQSHLSTKVKILFGQAWKIKFSDVFFWKNMCRNLLYQILKLHSGIDVNVWLKWKILLDLGKWHIFWRFRPYWVQKYPFRQDRWKIRRWWVILPRPLPYLLILHKYFFQSCNSLVILCLFNSLQHSTVRP